MITQHRIVVALRLALVALFGILVVFQTLSLPGQWAHMADESPQDARLRWPLTAISVFLVLCVQVVIVATWRLLRMVDQDRIFTDAAMGWVNAIIGAMAAAWSVLLGVFVYVGAHADDPGAPMVLLLMLIGLSVIGLLMIVMRALLLQATALRADLQEVI
jgi:hypothetical protein